MMSALVLLLMILTSTVVSHDGLASKHLRYHKGDEEAEVNLVLPYSGEQVRIRSSEKLINSGLLEVYEDKQWRYICDDGWSLEEANVACRQLGFTRGFISLEFLNDNEQNAQQSSNAEFALTRVKCLGTESSLKMCYRSNREKCSGNRAVSVTCLANKGCPEGWIAGFGKCYKFYSKAKNIQLAATVCAREDTSLVTIDSVAENHFLSSVLKNSVPSIQQWYTGGTKIGDDWKWNNYALNHDNTNNSTKRNSRPTFTSMQSSVDFDRWFPGWPLSHNKFAEPANNKPYNCLTLSDKFRGPTNSPVTVDYFYWKAASCSDDKGIHFICQLNYNEANEVKQTDDCYNGSGLDYRGTASVSDNGNVCLTWDASDLMEYPDKGLGDHNYCRNPDNDVRPWCWTGTEDREFEYCKLPECSEQESSLEQAKLTTPQTVAPQTVAPQTVAQTTISTVEPSPVKCGIRPYDSEETNTDSESRGIRSSQGKAGYIDDVNKWVQSEGKIIGGDTAVYGSLPWQGRIHQIDRFTPGVKHICGFVILNEFWLLTAAHCFFKLNPFHFKVIVGDYSKSKKDREEQSFHIDELILHEEYVHATKNNDIALIRIKPSPGGRGIQYGYNVRPICLPEYNYSYVDNMDCSVSGWGTMKNEDRTNFPDLLRTATVPLVSQSMCRFLHLQYQNGFLSDRMFCAGFTKGSVDTCEGDSGGPLICQINGVYTSLGITSWGRGCALDNAPGVYTRVSVFVPWIESKINSHSLTEAHRILPSKP